MLKLFERRPPAASIQEIEVRHAGEIYRVALKRLKSSRRFTLRVRAASRDVLLTIPSRSSLASAREFAERHAAWIGARLSRLPRPVAFAPGERLPLRGVEHTIVHAPQARGVVWIETRAEGALLCVAGEAPHVARRVADFLRREAKRDLEAAVVRHALRAGVTPRRITLRDTASRWGSCSTNANLNFSWRLILAPPFVLDYVVAHEVAHLRQMNHGPRFWALVRELVEDIDLPQAWLSKNGPVLHRYAPRITREATTPR